MNAYQIKSELERVKRTLDRNGINHYQISKDPTVITFPDTQLKQANRLIERDFGFHLGDLEHAPQVPMNMFQSTENCIYTVLMTDCYDGKRQQKLISGTAELIGTLATQNLNEADAPEILMVTVDMSPVFQREMTPILLYSSLADESILSWSQLAAFLNAWG